MYHSKRVFLYFFWNNMLEKEKIKFHLASAGTKIDIIFLDRSIFLLNLQLFMFI